MLLQNLYEDAALGAICSGFAIFKTGTTAGSTVGVCTLKGNRSLA